MSAYPKFDSATVENISNFFGKIQSNSQITSVLEECHLIDDSGESTKWRKLYAIFIKSQNDTNSSNQILGYIKSCLAPTRFVGKSDELNKILKQLNPILLMQGLEYGDDGEFHQRSRASTPGEAETRVQGIVKELRSRNVHGDVYKYCTSELMEKNYFHAVYEASKGLLQKVRDMSGIEGDGTKLIDTAFSINDPYLAFNALTSQTDISEHNGFAHLLKGCVGIIRNPLAHKPKILWDWDDKNDVIDYLSLISLMHRKLDKCFTVPRNSNGADK